MNQRKANFTVLIVFALACRSATAQDDLKRATRILKPNVDHAVVLAPSRCGLMLTYPLAKYWHQQSCSYMAVDSLVVRRVGIRVN